TCSGSQLETPSNGNSELSFPNPEADEIIQTFQCNVGYQLDSVDTTAICIDGKWIPETPPTCLPKDDQFVINTNGRLDGREISTVEKDSIYLDCIVPESLADPTWTKLVDGTLKVTVNSFRSRMQFPTIGLSDAGIYCCSVGQNNETIHISVKPLNGKKRIPASFIQRMWLPFRQTQ
ncbi:uncharacterized protein LOC117119580, partial [Anneissia japonica]|uniref:uncharacterized protein LOC117119580 n=1 Tax=Anneissia japonica TaxID=1529436 RepID=UPI0014259F99